MAGPLGRKEIIEFLVSRKFPPMTLATLPPSFRRGGTTTLDRSRRRDEASQYEGELASLPIERLESLYEDAQAQVLAYMHCEEDARFFNQAFAAADFDHWCKAEHWSLDEAIALVMGKAPEIVSWEKIKAYSGASPFVMRYARLRDLAERAKLWEKLYDPVLPPIFLKWANDNEIAVPAELSDKVTRLKGKYIDWKQNHAELQTNYDKLRSMYAEHIANWEDLVRKKSELIDIQQQRIEDLKAQLACSKQEADSSSSAKAQSPIERQNMLKAIYTMAKKGYGYDPTGKRSTIVSEIASDMALEGLPLSEDTVRRYLNEARESLTAWKENGQ